MVRTLEMLSKVAVGLVLFVIGAAVHAQVVTDEVDQFTGKRIIAYTVNHGKVDLKQPVFTIKAVIEKGTTAFGVNLTFVSAYNRSLGTGWRFLKCHRVDWLVDGSPLPAASEASYSGDVIRGGTIESITQIVDPAWAKKVTAANSVQYRVCNDVFVLDPGAQRAFGDIAAKLEGSPPPARSTAPTPTNPQPVQPQSGMKWKPKSL